MADHLQKLTILHSNDIHGDFLGDGDETGATGISGLSGYVVDARTKDPANTLYMIAGDMLQGSLIDTEFKGLSTIEIMNAVNPDVACLGNHEIDYGLAHLLLLERCAKFPIVCSNLYIRRPYTRLFGSHKILDVAGLRIMVIGLVTEEVLSSIRLDNLLGTLVDVDDAAREVGRICNAYRDIDIDLTILLTHIGFEEDKKLAALLDPDWGVDLIIGGHSHTVLDKPAEVNGIVITQAGHGTSHIGRFELVLDTDKNTIDSYEWNYVDIKAAGTPRDTQLEAIIDGFEETVDEKYDQVLCKLHGELTHPARNQETQIGNLFADALKERLGVELMMVGSGSIRKEQLGPIVTRMNLMEIMPYDDKVIAFKVTGAQLKHMVKFMLRDETLDGAHGEFYQFSKGIAVTYDKATHSFTKFDFMGQPVKDDDVVRVGLQEYHWINFDRFFDLPKAELVDGKGTVATTSIRDVLEEYLATTHRPTAQLEGRWVVV